ncbi:MAG: 4Fe-4S binding protein [Deltaproteobacteria bacterium]|jgi:ferredoxin|nr:4Fe-4S binding protein [Deltaproteobacteria bacterium]MBW2532352.1 4Fe-4S binding protein [Deltaproteobacteria bacterium]
MVPVIDAYRCDGCGVCVLRCPPQIMGVVKGVAVLVTELCEECGICNDVCPIDAVRFRLPHKVVGPKHDAYREHPR